MQLLKFTYRLWPDWVQRISARIPDPRVKAKCTYSMEQIFFSGLMVFVLRYRSLRSFCLENRGNERALKNFRRWISISEIPCDDELRYSLQTISTDSMNLLLKDLHQKLDRKKILNNEKFWGRHELVNLDGSGQLDSKNIHCELCLEKNLDNGTHFYHGQLLASITNINASFALPFQFEPIQRSDTETKYSKNDCELNAAKRLIANLRTHFPKRSFCFLGDNLLSADAIIRQIRNYSWHFIITAKPERNKELFFMFDYLHQQRSQFALVDKNGTTHVYRWCNQLPLKQYTKNEEPINVNLLEYHELSPTGKILFQSSWITNFQISPENVSDLAKAGRARFSIENRNFNEQKNLGFQTEHNFGHAGNLPNVFFGLAQLAQLITELFSFWKEGKENIKAVGSKRRYFERLAVIVGEVILPDEPWPIFNLKFNFNSE